MRDVFLLKNVRIHIDEVTYLGAFLEFEAVVSPQCDVLQCHEQVNRLRREFGPIIGEAIGVSYCDLIDSLKREAATE
jgi:adenylate cyclase class IV